jgi:L-iditol 2-dehydrogenase
MTDSVRAAVLVGPGRYEVQEFPYPRLADGALLLQVEMVGICEPTSIEMLKRGGMMLEMGNFADTGEISLNVHRHICSKNIRLIGLTNHPSTGYGPALRLLERHSDRYPFAEMVTHEFGLHQADEALHTSMDPRSMKVAIVPGRTVF